MRSTLVLAYTILSRLWRVVASTSSTVPSTSSPPAITAITNGAQSPCHRRAVPLTPMYAIDPVMRREVDAHLQSKGYVLDPQRAQFTVHYLYVTGMVQGERSALASNITPYPRIMPTRRVDQASVDNAIALGGVKETNNLIVQFNDRVTNQEVWQVTLTEIVENANSSDTSRLDDNLKRSLQRALQPIPQAPRQ